MCDAADLAADDLAVAHQFDLGRIALVHGAKLRFLEIGVHPEGISVDDRDLIPSNGGIITQLRQEIGYPAVHRRTDLGALQVNLGLIAVGCVSARGLDYNRR